MQGAIVARGKRPNPGMEREVVKLADDVDAYARRLMEEGQITDFAWISGLTGGDGHLAIFTGDPQKLMALSLSPEFAEIRLRSTMTNEDWRVDLAVSGTSVDDTWPGWRQAVGG